MIKVKSKGDWSRTDKFFKKSIRISKVENLEVIADRCIERLKAATPKDSRLTAESWNYEIKKTKNRNSIYITNTNIQNGVSIALLLEVGHATINGGWVEGKEFVGPITLEVYNDILNETWKEMKRL